MAIIRRTLKPPTQQETAKEAGACHVARDEIQIQRDNYGSIPSAGDITNAALDAIICTVYTSHLPGEISKNWKTDKRRYQK